MADEEGLSGGVDDLGGEGVEVIELLDPFDLGGEAVEQAEVASGDAGDGGQRDGARDGVSLTKWTPVRADYARYQEESTGWRVYGNAAGAVLDTILSTPTIGGKNEGVNMSEVIAAFVAGGMALLVSGYALGGARRRKALGELLAIRAQLESRSQTNVSDDAEMIKKIDRLVNGELDAMAKVTNPSHQLLSIVAQFYGTLIFITVVGIWVANTVSDEWSPAVCIAAAATAGVAMLVVLIPAPLLVTRYGGGPWRTIGTLAGIGAAMVIAAALLGAFLEAA